MKKIICLLLMVFINIYSQPKGKLVIVGGVQTKAIQKKFVELAGGNKARIIIIPNAGSEPKRSSESQQRDYIDLGAKADYLLFTKETADNEENLIKLDWANAVFFLGGDQSNLTRDMLGTKLLKKVFDIYNNGGIVGGSSAGAAVMSEIMITGNELINKDSSSSFVSILKNNVETKQGFGFIKNAIIDQHFLKRKRYNRLLTLMCEHTNLLGIAIDESTAIIVNSDNTFDVMGRNQVIVFDPTSAEKIRNDSLGNLGISNMKLHILINGDKFDMHSKQVQYNQ